MAMIGRARRALFGGWIALSLVTGCTPADPEPAPAESALSAQTVECIDRAVVMTGTAMGSVYLLATQTGLALVPVSAGTSLALAEGIGTVVSAGALVAGLGAAAACNLDLHALWEAMMAAGATREANEVERFGAAQGSATCDTPDACCLDDTGAALTDGAEVEIKKLDVPQPGLGGTVEAFMRDVKVLDTYTGEQVLRDYVFRATIGLQDDATLIVKYIVIFSGDHRELDAWSYRYRPGPSAMKKLMDSLARAVAQRSPAQVKRMEIERHRVTDDYKGEACRNKVYDLERFRH